MAAHDRRPRRWVWCGAALLTVIALALFVTQCAGGRENTPPQTTTQAATTSPGATPHQENGVDVGFAPGIEGATSAAIAAATVSQRLLYLTDEQIERAVRTIASTESADELVALTLQEAIASRDGLAVSSGRVWWLVRPLATAVVSEADDRVSIEVWVVTVLSARDVAVPQADWRTVTVDLVWQSGDWKLDAIRERPGPTPDVGPADRPWDAIPFDEALEGFVRLDGETVR